MPLDGPTPASARRHTRGNKQLEEILDLLYRRRWIIAALTLLGLALSGAAQYAQTPTYTTSSLVLVELSRANASARGPSAPDEFVRDQRSVYTELFVLNASRGIRERVADRLGDDEGRLPPGAVSFSLADRNVSSGIRINASSTDPEAAAALANAYAEEYVTQTQIASRTYLTESREFLEQQAERLRGQVAAADATVEGRMASAGSTTLGSGALLGQLSTLRTQLGEAQIDRQMRQNRLASIESQLNDITPRLADRMASGTDRRVVTLEEQISGLEGELQTFERREAAGQDFDEARARTIRTRIANLEREKEAAAAQYVEEVMSAGGIAAPAEALSYVADLQGQAAQERVALSGLSGRISQLNSRIAQVNSELGRAPSQTISLERASQDREAASSTYATVVSQLEQVRVQEESEPGYARVLREAPVPRAPTGPGWTRVIGLGLMVGLGLGMGLAIVVDRLDNRVYKPEHVAALGVPVLETIPDLGPVLEDVLGGAETLPVNGRDVVTDLVTIHAPLSPASETYRHLRTAVQFSRPNTVVKTILVTSAAPGEGKSTTAANLATTFAQGGRTTVLIDADLRRPRTHEQFGAPSHPGLFQLSQARVDSSELPQTLSQSFATGVEDLFVIPAGALALEDASDSPDDGRAIIPNPAEVLGSSGFRDLLAELSKAVDVVVIDTPPVLVATDAVLLSAQADATVLVVSAGASKVGDIQQALSHLDDVGAQVAGAVLNRFTLDNAKGYAYTYGHYSRYGAYSKYSYTGKQAPKKRVRGKRDHDSKPRQTV
ncbi:polysaccharide biosynthesis tyrosine autokinase [Rubrivirga sp.]|uniref:polysaccharide biosynthesis tyrosine autokinase n=1 Tax=Rubrivirga sp. TaxID=1885344 RepID=UPI003C707F71